MSKDTIKLKKRNIKMGRKKRFNIQRSKVFPKIFHCPKCGEKTIKVFNLRKGSRLATIKCGNCGIAKKIPIHSYSEAIDVFGSFIDIYYSDQEIQRLENQVQKQEKNKDWKNLKLTYSLLSEFYIAKTITLTEAKEIEMWKNKAKKFEELRRKTLSKINSENIKQKIIKKDKTVADVFDDPGFLEF